MENSKINIFQRFIKSVSDFTFVNQFKNESVGKAIGFMLLGYLLFSLMLGGIINYKISPVMNEMKESVDEVFEVLPDFTIAAGKLSLDNGETFKKIDIEEIVIIFDLEGTDPREYYKTGEDNIILVTESIIYFGQNSEPLDLSVATTELNNESLKSIFAYVKIGVVVVIVLAFIFGILGVFIISALMWGVVIVISNLTNKNISLGDCYKITIYSMVAPGVLTLVIWGSSFDVPLYWVVYTAVVGIYSYLFMNHFSDEENYYVEE